MVTQPYDPVGAMGGLFAPAYIHGDPEAEAATIKWQAENFAMTPAMVEATRGPSTTITDSGVMGRGSGLGSTTTTIPGTVDPAALKILAQGGHYTPRATPVVPAASGSTMAPSNPRDMIAQALMARDMMPDQGTGQRGGYPWGQIGPNVTS